MRTVVVWMGPVATADLASVPMPEGWSILTIGDTVRPPERPSSEGVTPADFRAWAAARLGSDPLTSLLVRAQADACVLASFSAGHGLLELLLDASPGDDRILGVLSADSYYGRALKPGYLRHAQVSIDLRSRRPFWLTTSNSKGGVTTSSGTESVEPFARELDLRPVAAPRGVPRPVRALGRAPVVWLDYGQADDGPEAHRRQAVEIAPAVLRTWLEKNGGSVLPLFALGAALAWGLSS